MLIITGILQRLISSFTDTYLQLIANKNNSPLIYI